MALPNFPNNYAAKEFQKHDFSYHFILFLHGKLMSVLPWIAQKLVIYMLAWSSVLFIIVIIQSHQVLSESRN